jgi:AbrB family looped-hinge helix DNA binding protein
MSRSGKRTSLAGFFYGSVTVGERGQVVIPAEARKENGFAPGDKLLVFRHPHLNGVVLARVDDVQALMAEMQQWTESMAAAGEADSEQ